MNINTTRLAANLRQVSALAAIVVGVLTSQPILNVLPTGVSAVLVAIGGAVVVIEHHNASSGTNSAQDGSGGSQTSPVAPTTGKPTAPTPPPTLPPTRA
jgi:hypothetical protein